MTENNKAPQKESLLKKGALLKKVVFSFLLVNTLYWSSIQLLHTYCAPSGFNGFITALWTSQHPMCRLFGSIHTNMDQMMLTWPGIVIGAGSLYLPDLVGLT